MKSEAEEYNGSSVDVKIFGTFERAKAYMGALVQSFKENFSEWEDEAYICEETENSFDWWEDGEYDVNHYCLTIREEEIN